MHDKMSSALNTTPTTISYFPTFRKQNKYQNPPPQKKLGNISSIPSSGCGCLIGVCIACVLSVLLVLHLSKSFYAAMFWSNGDAFVPRAEGLRLKSRPGQIEHGVVNVSPLQQNFFKRRCVVRVQWGGDGPRKLKTLFDVILRVQRNIWFDNNILFGLGLWDYDYLNTVAVNKI